MSTMLENAFYSGGGGVILITTLFALRKTLTTRKKRCFPRDVVVIRNIGGGRGPHAPSLSPFVIKLELYLKVAKIPYVIHNGSGRSSKGKLPWITYNGKDVADTHFIIEYLNEEFNVDLNRNFTPEEKAVGRAFQTLIEDNLFWVDAIVVFLYSTTEQLLKLMTPPVPYPVARWILPRLISKQAHAQGMGRHSPDQIYQLGRLDLKSFSHYLGEKKYLLGDEISEYDCSAFGMLAQIWWHGKGYPLNKYIIEELQNVGEYLERIKTNFWPDWDECITHGKTRPATKYFLDA